MFRLWKVLPKIRLSEQAQDEMQTKKLKLICQYCEQQFYSNQDKTLHRKFKHKKVSAKYVQLLKSLNTQNNSETKGINVGHTKSQTESETQFEVGDIRRKNCKIPNLDRIVL